MKKLKSDIILIIVAVIAIAGSLSSIFWEKDGKPYKDNPFEECAEEVIKSMTGVDVDLSPESKE